MSESPQAAALLSQTTATKWLYQTVRVVPGGWYQAGARLQPLAGSEVVHVRIAWYASADGSGSQLATVDSEQLLGAYATLVAVTTGPVEAPTSARSAQLRILLRPLAASPAMPVADDASFVAVAAPTPTPTPSPTPTPTLTPTATPTASPTASPAPRPLASPPPTPAPAATAAPLLVVGAAADASPAPAGADAATISAAQLALRITELLPNPAPPGPDAAFE